MKKELERAAAVVELIEHPIVNRASYFHLVIPYTISIYFLNRQTDEI